MTPRSYREAKGETLYEDDFETEARDGFYLAAVAVIVVLLLVI